MKTTFYKKSNYPNTCPTNDEINKKLIEVIDYDEDSHSTTKNYIKSRLDDSNNELIIAANNYAAKCVIEFMQDVYIKTDYSGSEDDNLKLYMIIAAEDQKAARFSLSDVLDAEISAIEDPVNMDGEEDYWKVMSGKLKEYVTRIDSALELYNKFIKAEE